MSQNKPPKRKSKGQILIPFDGVAIENLKFDFTSVTNEEFEAIIDSNSLELELEKPIGRKRQWTIENLVNEIKKYKTLEQFKKEKSYLWTLYKQLVLIEKKNSSTIVSQDYFPNSNIKPTSDKAIQTKQISVLEYSKKINPTYFRQNRKYPDSPLTRHSIMYRIRNDMPLPEVLKYDRIGKVHVLTVLKDF
jgi:hypothetical protein